MIPGPIPGRSLERPRDLPRVAQPVSQPGAILGSLSPPYLCLCSHAPEWPRLPALAGVSLPLLALRGHQEWSSVYNQAGEQEEAPTSGQASPLLVSHFSWVCNGLQVPDEMPLPQKFP